MKTVSSREFNQNVAATKRAAKDGPVIVTDRGEPSHVLLSFEEYGRLNGRGVSIAEALSHPESAHINFEVPRMKWTPRSVDFE